MPPAHDHTAPARFPILQGVLPIITARIPAEILAGITLAAIDVPEVIGYTKIAGAAGPSQSLVAARSSDPRLSRIFDESGLHDQTVL